VNEWIAGGRHANDIAIALSERLDEFIARFDLVLVCDEPLLSAILHCGLADRLSSRIPFIPASAQLAVYLDNVQFLIDAREAGAAIPEFEVCRTRREARAVASRLSYPVILKRSVSMAGSGVQLVRSERELDDQVPGSGEQSAFLVQRYVEGRVGGTTMLLDHGAPVRWFSFYKLFNWPTPFSPSGGGEMMSDSQVERLVELIAPLHGFHGPCSIDWIHENGTGRIFLLEFNPRVTPNAYRGAHVGADFATAFRAMADGSAPVPMRGGNPGRTFEMFPEAAFRAFEDANPLLLRRCLTDAPYSDPRLLLALTRRLMSHYVPLGWKRRLARMLGR
jgi:glutathione synthase/RimK-type ligase-like ATP-grasp enzyme